MRNASDKSCRDNQNTQFVFRSLFFENRAVYEKKWKNSVEPVRPDDNMAHAHCKLDT